MQLWRRRRQGKAQTKGDWSLPIWVGLEQALRGWASEYVHPTPKSHFLGPWCTPWSGIYAKAHSVYCPIPSVNVYADKHHRTYRASLTGTTQRTGQEAPHHNILLVPGLGWSSLKVL